MIYEVIKQTWYQECINLFKYNIV